VGFGIDNGSRLIAGTGAHVLEGQACQTA
jgi:hypothetical protein